MPTTSGVIMKSIVLILGMGIVLAGCTETKEVEKPELYSVEFLVKQENKDILNKLMQECKAELATGKSVKEVMSDPNCSNAEIATDQRQTAFNSSGGTRRASTRAFADPKSSEDTNDQDVNSEDVK